MGKVKTQAGNGAKKSVTSKPGDVKIKVVANSVKKNPAKKGVTQRAARRFTRKTAITYTSDVSEVEVPVGLPLHEIAPLLGKDLCEIVLMLLQKGKTFTRNQLVPREIIVMLAHELGIDVIKTAARQEKTSDKPSLSKENLVERWPVVVVMGHVDHGKTTLLDYVRKSSVAVREKGGITQHVAAYEVDTSHGRIVFLDTPGHEAFVSVRGRGVRVTDMAILIVAADDGVMPQTVEAIKSAQEAEVPIIVAINKVDKEGVEGNIESIKRQLAQHDVLVEDWGGETVCTLVSAKTGHGVDELLEMIVLQTQMMDLKADPNIPASAFVLESKVERGYGSTSTVIVSEGTLKRGDSFICGNGATGRVRLLLDSADRRIDEAGPSIPVKVVGFDVPAAPGGWLKVVSSSAYAKARSTKPGSQRRAEEPTSFGETIVEEEVTPLIIKADTHGSCDAVEYALKGLCQKNKDVGARLKILSNTVGDIMEGDVLRAENAGATIVGFNIRVERNALSSAQLSDVKILIHHIIYHLIEDVEKFVMSRVTVVKKYKQCGKAEVRKVFDMKGRGIIAGCYVTDGVVRRGNKVVCMRGEEKIGEGTISSLQKERKVVKDTIAGYECGFICEDFKEWQVGDIALCLEEETE
ncbi:translation initiation factor IF-2 [Candidatus Babeliales bacterium]|nr:translation initiation factor IF-2 [Candidatus Babeliales bacterium]